MAGRKKDRPEHHPEDEQQEFELGEELDELDEDSPPDPVGFWEHKQRELVTSVVDYNLDTLAGLVKSKKIDTSPKYQRRFRWDAKRQSALIESFLMNVPVPPIFLNEDQYGTYSVIDGKQRLTAISEFLAGRLTLTGLKVFSDINGSTFDDLPDELQNVLRIRPTLRAQIILRQSDKDIKFEVFRRLNTGGVRLNAQEVRNSAFPGPLNDLILKLSESKHFHVLLNISNKAKSALYQEMRDAEFVLRFFAFRKEWRNFSGGMKRQMDDFMLANQRAPQSFLEEIETDFVKTVAAVEAAFGRHAFRRWMPEKGQWRKPVLASLYDAEMFACRGLSATKLLAAQSQIVAGTKSLFKDVEFRKAVDSATNTPAFFKDRIRTMRDFLRTTIGE